VRNILGESVVGNVDFWLFPLETGEKLKEFACREHCFRKPEEENPVFTIRSGGSAPCCGTAAERVHVLVN
jgi:hypothetical protein